MLQFSRRNFLQGVSTIALTAALPCESEAGLHGHGVAQGFNGGKTQVNTTSPFGPGSYQFINFIKSASEPNYNSPPTDPTAPKYPILELDANGYPTSIVAGTGGYYVGFTIPNANQYSGTWVLKWDGTGTALPASFQFTTTLTTANRVEFTNNNTGADFTGCFIQVISIGAFPNHLKNLRMCRGFPTNDEALMDAGQVWFPDHLALMKSAKPGAIRSLGWGGGYDGTNTALIGTWAQRRPVGYIQYGGYKLNPNYFGGTTTSSGTDYTLAYSGFSLTDKALVHLIFDADVPHIRNTTVQLSWVAVASSAINIFWGTAHGLAAGNMVTFGNGQSTLIYGSINGTTLTIDSTRAGTFKAGSYVAGPGVLPNTYVVSGSGATWTVNNNHATPTGLQFIYQDAAPAPMASAQFYFVKTVIDAYNFTISETSGGTALAALVTSSGSMYASAVARINVNGTGFVKMTDFQTPNPSNIGSINGMSPQAGLSTIVYDQTTDWFHISTSGPGLVCGGPPEVFIDYCAAIGANPWLTAPFMSLTTGGALGGVTDYMPSWVTYAKNTYPWMKPVIEPYNETWNPTLAGLGTYYASTLSFALWTGPIVAGLGRPIDEAYGKWVSDLGQAISTIYGNDRTKYSMICATQGDTFHDSAGMSINDARLTSALYVSQSGGSPAYLWTDRVCTANYITPAEAFTCQELIDAFAYSVTFANDPTQQSAIADGYANTTGATSGNTRFTLSYVDQLFTNLVSWAMGMPAGHTIKGVVGYEGGWSPDLLGGDWATGVIGATQANPCVLTLASTSGNSATGGLAGNPAVVGMQVNPSGIAGMSQLNGNTYTISKVGVSDGLLANEIAINVDSRAFSAYASGGAIGYVNSMAYSNTLRVAGGNSAALGPINTQMYENFFALASDGFIAEYPSNFIPMGKAGVWSVLQPNMYAPLTPQWNSIVAANS